MKRIALLVLTLASACITVDDPTSDPTPSEPPVMDEPDAPMDMPPAEPKPEFTAGSQIGGQLAIDDVGIRETFKINGETYLSVVKISLTETATDKHCGVTLGPKFVQFGSSSTSTRHFKTVILDFAGSTVLEDTCGWDDAHILAGLDARFGHYIVGFAQARFTEDRPYVDVYLNAVHGLGNSTSSVVSAGGGSAYQMAADGTVVEVMVQPTPGTLLPALYDF